MTVGSAIEQAIMDILEDAKFTSANPDWINTYWPDQSEIRGGIPQLIDAEIKKAIDDALKNQKSSYGQANAHVKAFKKTQQSQNLHVQAFQKYQEIQQKADLDMLRNLTGDIQMVTTLMRSPVGWLTSVMTAAAPIIVPALLAIALPEIIKAILDKLAQPGNPLDPRFKRLLDEEFNSGLTRQQQFNTAIGSRKIVVQSEAGWRNLQGAGHSSNMRDIKEGSGFGPRTGKVGIEDKSVGL
jgi:hypothetical protein